MVHTSKNSSGKHRTCFIIECTPQRTPQEKKELSSPSRKKDHERQLAKMDFKEDVLLSAINEATKNWKIKVQVVQKLPPRISKNQNSKFHTIIFADEQGKMIQGTIFDEQIRQFDKTIQLNHNYYLSDAKIQRIPEKYRYVDHEYQLILEKQTKIQQIFYESFELPEDPLCFVELKNLENLRNFINFDILVLVLNISKLKTSDKSDTAYHELLIINEESMENKEPLKQIRDSNNLAIASTSEGKSKILDVDDITTVFKLFHESGDRQDA
ncbi:hypothetical protein QJS10_CPB11g01438 [Acorus calamus]|uniref:Replication protein A 70 kDa DNA-binding subunit B/D first OB fold domain-containing protein n=1 Tax=Acorus calamus TaxID=4465 RepID=A0AAV9DQA7_ACOCL|nr:hypothetical protein QJS10_CPB11g01438 [Acorus calamus]